MSIGAPWDTGQIRWEVYEAGSNSQELILFTSSSVLKAVSSFTVRGFTSQTSCTFVTADVSLASFAPKPRQSSLVALTLFSELSLKQFTCFSSHLVFFKAEGWWCRNRAGGPSSQGVLTGGVVIFSYKASKSLLSKFCAAVRALGCSIWVVSKMRNFKGRWTVLFPKWIGTKTFDVRVLDSEVH